MHRRCIFYTSVSLLCLLLVTGPVIAASLEANVDRSNIEFGQSIALTVTATGLNGEIDFSVLEGDFDILDTRRSRNVRIVNGKSDSSLVWQIGLMPLNTGELTIPSFSLDGISSKALLLSVGEARSEQQGMPAGEDFFLDIQVDKTEVFVQEQIILTARVYQARNIIEGSLSDPGGDGLMLQRLGSDQTSTTTINGRQYNVIERRYALFAQESGKHSIAPLRLVATVRQDNRSGSRSGFFTPTQKIRVASNSLQLTVKPKPSEGKSGWWLPAEALNLTANWEEDIAQARVDEPLTRSISLAAKAVVSTQLPPLDIPELDGAKVYPDQPDVQTQTDGESLITYRTDKWAIIPRKVGPLKIPEVRVEWYDTINKKLQYAILPEQVIEILPAESSTSSIKSQSTPTTSALGPSEVESIDRSQTPENSALTAQVQAVADDSARKWKLAFFVVLMFWLVTLGVWFWRAKAHHSVVQADLPVINIRNRVSLRDVETACRSEDPSQIIQSLLRFSEKKWPDNTPLSMGELAVRLQHTPLSQQLNALDQAVYSKSAEKSDFGALINALEAALAAFEKPEKNSSAQKSLLPNL